MALKTIAKDETKSAEGRRESTVMILGALVATKRQLQDARDDGVGGGGGEDSPRQLRWKRGGVGDTSVPHRWDEVSLARKGTLLDHILSRLILPAVINYRDSPPPPPRDDVTPSRGLACLLITLPLPSSYARILRYFVTSSSLSEEAKITALTLLANQTERLANHPHFYDEGDTFASNIASLCSREDGKTKERGGRRRFAAVMEELCHGYSKEVMCRSGRCF